MEKIMILDTEVNDKFVYDLGLIIAEKQENGQFLAIEKHQFIVEQIYYNHRLFTSQYYKEKRKKYTSLMKGRKAIVKKFGYITQIVDSIIKRNNIEKVYAYNCNFDKSRINYTCKDFNVKNPFDNMKWYDLQAIANNLIHLHESYINFAISNNYINSSGYLETTAEITYRFLINDTSFIEEHTSLADCEIELEMLNYCITKGYLETETYKQTNIPSQFLQVLTIYHQDKEYKFEYNKRKNSNKDNSITLT